MQIVIDVPDEIYLSSKRQVFLLGSKMISDCLSYYGEIINVIASGTPLLKGHGRLIDTNDLIKLLNEHMEFNWQIELCIGNTPTIIEADTEEKEI